MLGEIDTETDTGRAGHTQKKHQMMTYLKKTMAEAGGARMNSRGLDSDIIAHCIEEYYKPVGVAGSSSVAHSL